MYLSCILVTLVVVGTHSRYITEDDLLLAPMWISRVRRDAHGAVTVNSDGTSGALLKVPLTGNDQNILSAIGRADLDKNLKLSAATAGLALDNVNGHSATLTNTHLPGFGDKLTAAANVNLFKNDDHNIDVNAFATKNMPDLPRVPDFNTFGGGVDYMFKDKVGASASAAHTDFINRNDYSLGGKVNLLRTPDSSLDFNAAYKKFDTPFIKSDWTPNFGFSFSKYF